MCRDVLPTTSYSLGSAHLLMRKVGDCSAGLGADGHAEEGQAFVALLLSLIHKKGFLQAKCHKGFVLRDLPLGAS